MTGIELLFQPEPWQLSSSYRLRQNLRMSPRTERSLNGALLIAIAWILHELTKPPGRSGKSSGWSWHDWAFALITGTVALIGFVIFVQSLLRRSQAPHRDNKKA